MPGSDREAAPHKPDGAGLLTPYAQRSAAGSGRVRPLTMIGAYWFGRARHAALETPMVIGLLVHRGNGNRFQKSPSARSSYPFRHPGM